MMMWQSLAPCIYYIQYIENENYEIFRYLYERIFIRITNYFAFKTETDLKMFEGILFYHRPNIPFRNPKLSLT